MGSAATVLVCALFVLGRNESSMPRIELITAAPADVSVGAEAFVRRETGTIYVITSSGVFQEAAAAARPCDGGSHAMRKLASILAHEEWHIRHGPDEKSAYEYQLTTLVRLGLPPGTSVYYAVQKSMLRVLEVRKNQAEGVLARR
jgi:hypothetical protein